VQEEDIAPLPEIYSKRELGEYTNDVALFNLWDEYVLDLAQIYTKPMYSGMVPGARPFSNAMTLRERVDKVITPTVSELKQCNFKTFLDNWHNKHPEGDSRYILEFAIYSKRSPDENQFEVGDICRLRLSKADQLSIHSGSTSIVTPDWSKKFRYWTSIRRAGIVSCS